MAGGGGAGGVASTRGRISSDNCVGGGADNINSSRINKSASTMSAYTKRRGFSIGSNKGSLDEKKEGTTAAAAAKESAEGKGKLSKFNLGGSRKKILDKKVSSQTSEEGGGGGGEEQEVPGKRVTNLKDFYSLTTKSPTSTDDKLPQQAVAGAGGEMSGGRVAILDLSAAKNF